MSNRADFGVPHLTDHLGCQTQDGYGALALRLLLPELSDFQNDVNHRFVPLRAQLVPIRLMIRRNRVIDVPDRLTANGQSAQSTLLLPSFQLPEAIDQILRRLSRLETPSRNGFFHIALDFFRPSIHAAK